MKEKKLSLPAGALILLTGASGAIGNELLRQLTGKAHVVVLSRRQESAIPLPTSMTAADCGVIVGDLRDPDLPAVLRKRAPADVTHIIHAAAEVRWNSPGAIARDVNIGGTRRVLEYASSLAKLNRLCLLSTAYVCGSRSGYIAEDDPCPEQYNNAYEESKAAAEGIVTNAIPESLIIRPSIVLGASNNGEIARFRTLYPLLSAWNRGGLPLIIGKDSVNVDVVPVDWVARSILALLAADATGAFHLVTGQRPPTLGELTTAAIVALNVLRLEDDRPALPAPILVDPLTYARLHDPLVTRSATLRQRVILQAFDMYRPYLAVSRQFANIGLRRALREQYTSPPALIDFIAPVMRYWWHHKGAYERDGSLSP